MNRDYLTLGPAWYVITVAPRKEAEAEQVLIRHGYEVARPVQRHWRRISGGGKRKEVEIAMLPRYLFLRCSGWPNMYRLESYYGKDGRRLVMGYLAMSARERTPCPIPDAIVSQLMGTTTDGLERIHRSIKPGDAVTHPALAGAVGRLIRASDKIATIAVEMFSSLHEVNVSIHKLDAA